MATSPKIEQTNWTVEDYMNLDDDNRYEVLRGTLMMVPSPNMSHQRVITRLGTLIDIHVMENGLGECFDAPFDVVLSENTVLQPDFTYVTHERLEQLEDGHTITGAPNLVIEVLSPSTQKRDRHKKRDIYAEAGVEWLILVEPDAHVVEVHKLSDAGTYEVTRTAAEDDTLTFGLFPDLEIDLSDVWMQTSSE